MHTAMIRRFSFLIGAIGSASIGSFGAALLPESQLPLCALVVVAEFLVCYCVATTFAKDLVDETFTALKHVKPASVSSCESSVSSPVTESQEIPLQSSGSKVVNLNEWAHQHSKELRPVERRRESGINDRLGALSFELDENALRDLFDPN